ncbi:MAG: penicillin-binding protein 2 [Caldilineaceae bacterium]|nr:penicillin-binding protein 2 [Caldilineaceae bacterium]
MSFERDTPNDTGKLSMVLFRIALVITFFVLLGRLFQLQVVQGETFRTRSDNNRYDLVEVSAKRGVIYDRNGTILARNRPSFEVAIVPEDIPFDDPATPADEEAVEIEKVLHVLRADTDTDIALRIAELMFRRLGRSDYAKAVEGAGISLNYIQVPTNSVLETTSSQMAENRQEYIDIPDISEPLPMAGLVALVQSLVSSRKLGTASQPIPILNLVDRIQAFEVDEESYRLPSVRVLEVPVREYVYKDLMSHILGFMGPIPKEALDRYRQRGYTNQNEKVGLNGLEYSYQTELRGIPGYRYMEVDILGSEMRTVGTPIEAKSGSNLVLNVDRRLQEVMRDTLQAAMDERGAKWGVTIAMNPQNGAVLGLVSLPSYDNNIFAEQINIQEYKKLEQDDRLPLINYAIGGLYPPGSTYKIISAAGALAEGIIEANTQIVDNGPIYLPNQFFPNDFSQAQPFVSWNHRLGIVHGAMTIIDGLALSNDIFFYWIGGGYPPARFPGLGNKNLAKWTELFGYGQLTGIDIPGEVTFLVPDDQWKRQRLAESWTTGDSYNMSIGQGYVLATPLQVLSSFVAIANGGTLYVPQLVYQITDANGAIQRDFMPKVIRQLPLSQEDIQTVQQGLWEVVNGVRGTAPASRVEGVEIAGKTGTAEFCEVVPKEDDPEELDCRRDKDDNLPTHAWYAAYAPYENPEIAVVAFVYDGGEGSATTVPIVQKILEAYFTEISPR